MRILSRYLLKAAAGPFFFALSVLTGLLMINTVARRIEDLAGKGLPPSVIAEVFGLSLPHVLALTLPMAVLVAVLYAFSQLAADNEITALKASGINLVSMVVPLLVGATILAGVMLWFNDQLLPETNHQLKNLLIDVSRKSPTLQLEERVINPIPSSDYRTRYYLQAAAIDPSTNALTDVVIWDMSDAEQTRTIYADSGQMAFNRERTDLFLTLYDGHINQLEEGQPDRFQRVFFQQQVIRMQGVGNQLERSQDESFRGEREMGLFMLKDEADKRRAQLADVRTEIDRLAREGLDRTFAGDLGAVREPAERDSVGAAGAGGAGRPGRPFETRVPGERRGTRPDALSLSLGSELGTLASRARTTQLQIDSFEVEFQKKLAIPFACIVFVLIGAPLAVRFPRGGVGMVIAISLWIFAIYYVGLIGGEKLADKGIVDPFWSMWATNAIFFILGVWGMMRIGHEASTTRGGGWDDLVYSLKRFVTTPVRRLRERAS